MEPVPCANGLAEFPVCIKTISQEEVKRSGMSDFRGSFILVISAKENEKIMAQIVGIIISHFPFAKIKRTSYIDIFVSCSIYILREK